MFTLLSAILSFDENDRDTEMSQIQNLSQKENRELCSFKLKVIWDNPDVSVSIKME